MFIIAHFTQSGTPTTGLAPTVRAFDLSDNSVELTDVSMSEVGSGFYKYNFGTYSEEIDYSIVVDGGSGLLYGDRYKVAGNDDFGVPAYITALNDLSAAEVQAELTTYDAPRRSEATSDKDEVLAAVVVVTGDIASLNDLSTGDVDARLTAYDVATSANVAAATADIAALNDLGVSDLNAAFATYDGPTHAELTGLIATVTGDIDSLNNLSSAEAEAAADAALATYDGPTLAELSGYTATITSMLEDIQGATFNSVTDSLEAIRDRGDAEWVTGGGGSITEQDITNACTTALNSYDPPTLTELSDYTAEITGMLEDIEGATFNGSTDSLEAIRNRGDDAWYTGAGGGITEASVTIACTTALNNYDPPTHAEITSSIAEVTGDIAALNDISTGDVAGELATYDGATQADLDSSVATLTAYLEDIEGDTFDTVTDSLEAIRDRGDAAWITGGGGGITEEDITTACTTALNSYDPPTHTELVGLVATVTGDIDSLNDISSADATSAATAALNNYDPPTRAEATSDKTEITDAVSALNDLSAAEVNAEVDQAITDASLATAASIASLNDLSQAEVTPAVTTALNSYDPPTRSEATSDRIVITDALSAQNDLSAAQVNAEVDAALGEYDGPTYAEMVSQLAVVSGEIIAEITSVQVDLQRVLGLLHENVLIDQTTYVDDYMTAARVRFFDSAANVPETGDGSETTGLVATYTASGQYTGTALDWFRMEKV